MPRRATTYAETTPEETPEVTPEETPPETETDNDTEESEGEDDDVADEDTAPEMKEWYCPGCGRQYEYRQKCVGSAEAPHPPIEVVSTDELKGDTTDPVNLTAAPSSE